MNTSPFETYMNSTIRNWSFNCLGGIYNFVINSVEAGEITTWDEARGIISEIREKAHELNKDHEYYIDAINFCEKWDQASFDPNYKSMSLEEFAPMVKRIFSRKPYSLL